MRIGFDATCLPPFIAGAGRYICGLVSGLSAEDRSNEYFIILKKQDRHLFDNLPENFHLIEVLNLSRPLRIGWQLSAPRSLSNKYKLDVWHAPHYTLPRGMPDIYSVVTFHDMTFFLYPHFYSPAKRLFFQRMIRDATNRADAIVAVSKTTENDIRTLFGQSTHKLTHKQVKV